MANDAPQDGRLPADAAPSGIVRAATGAYDPGCYFDPSQRGLRRITAMAKGLIENAVSHDVAEYFLGEFGMGFMIGKGTIDGYNQANAEMEAETRACLERARQK